MLLMVFTIFTATIGLEIMLNLKDCITQPLLNIGIQKIQFIGLLLVVLTMVSNLEMVMEELQEELYMLTVLIKLVS